MNPQDSASLKRNYPETQNIKENAEALKGNAANLARHVIDDGKEAVSRTSDKARETLQDLREAGKRELQHLEETVRANPTRSIAIAFASGIAACLLFGRK